MVLRMIPQLIDTPIRILDVGAGYGALAAAVLRDRPNATAVVGRLGGDVEARAGENRPEESHDICSRIA
jgi:16S rRNA G1207 methylase RsmC